MSYDGKCYIGVNVDTGAIPDTDGMLECLREGFREVVDLAADVRPQTEGTDRARGAHAVGRTMRTVTPVVELRHVEIHGHRVGYRSAGSRPGARADPRHGRQLGDVAVRRSPHSPSTSPSSRRISSVTASPTKPRGDYSLGAFASGVRDLLLAFGHERATLVGQSLGGGVAMQFAYQFPERCERLVLVSSGGLGDEVNVLLRLLTLPGAELVLPLACNHWVHDAGVRVAG